MYIYVCLQTGIVRDTPPAAPSNYHYFRLPYTAHNCAQVAWMLDKATLDSIGLNYPKSVIDWFIDHDTAPGEMYSQTPGVK